MRPVVYSVAASLDGFIAGPNGEFDWIIQDPTMDFTDIFGAFDTILIGRHSYELMLSAGRSPKEFGMKVFVAATTLDPATHPDVQIIASGLAETVAGLKQKSGKDIWLFGGGVLFRSLLDAGLVDSVELAVSPIYCSAAASRCSRRAGAGHSVLSIARPCRRVGS